MTGKERKMGNQFVSNYVKEDPIQFNQPSLLKNKLSGSQHYACLRARLQIPCGL